MIECPSSQCLSKHVSSLIFLAEEEVAAEYGLQVGLVSIYAHLSTHTPHSLDFS